MHTDQHFAHMEAATQNLEDNACMGSPLAPLAVWSCGEDHTSAHEEGNQVDNHGHHLLSKLVAGGEDDSVRAHMSHWQPCGRVLVPLLDDAISLHHDGPRRRQLLLEMSELLIVHMSEKIAHHIHMATAHLLVDKEAAEGEDAREYKGEDIRLLRILLPDNNRQQGGEGERHSQLHLEDVRWRCTPMMMVPPPPSHAPPFFLPCFHLLPSWLLARMIINIRVMAVVHGKKCHYLNGALVVVLCNALKRFVGGCFVELEKPLAGSLFRAAGVRNFENQILISFRGFT